MGLKIIKKNKKQKNQIKNKKKLLFISISALGISSIVTQILLMREFLNLFSGNELVFGLLLGSWLLLTGIGSYLGKYIDKVREEGRLRLLVFSQIIIALLPFAYIILIRTLRNVVFLPGRNISFPEILISAVVLLAPYCIISGALLTLACIVFPAKKKEESIGQVYFIDNIGDIIGGVLFSFILIYLFSTFGIVYIIMVINLIAALLLSIFLIKKRLLSLLVCFLIIISIIISFTTNLDITTTKSLFPKQQLVFQKNSPYGNVIITKSGQQYNFFENGIALFSTENTIRNEETVHYALSQIQAGKDKDTNDVLLISGGVSGTIDEILKYDTNIDYVELDPLIIEIGRRFKAIDEKKVNIINTDGRKYVKQAGKEAGKAAKKYDAIIIDLPQPGSAQINRFYTDEFFKEAKRIMKAGGVLSLSMNAEKNYLSKEGKRLNTVMYNTLKNNFRNIIIVPGGDYFYIASDSALSYDIAKRLKEKNIKTEYVNENYLKGILTQDRIDYINNAVRGTEKSELNKDFKPVAYYYQLVYWASHYKTNLVLFLVILAAIFVYVITRLNPVTFAIFTTGFAAASLEIVILIAFQIMHGYAYSKIGIIITAFMIGLAGGAYFMNKSISRNSSNLGKKQLVILEFLMVLFSLALPIIIILINRANNNTLLAMSDHIIFPLLTIIIGILAGAEFPLAAKLFFKNNKKKSETGKAETAASLYSADLVGAFIGAVIVSSLLIPLLGIVNVCLIIAGLNLLSGFVLAFSH